MTSLVLLLWLAAIYRTWVSISQPTTLWRTSFTITTWSVAGAFTLHSMRQQVDLASGLPNVAGLAARVLMLVGIGFLLVYHEHLRRPTVPVRRLIGHLSLATAVIAVEVVAWSIAPVHNERVGDLVVLAESRAVVVYCVAFWVYFAVVLGVASRTCLAGGRTFRRTDPARSASLLLIGVGELLGIPVLLLWTASVLARHQGSDLGVLNRLGDFLLPWAVLLDALGVLSLLAVPYAAALVTRWRQWRRLRPLWAEMVARYPEVHLDLRAEGGPLGRLQLRVERAVIETRDALRIAPIAAGAPGVRAVDAVAQALGTEVDSSLCAADVLGRPESREADLEQLLHLADAYERFSHARA